MKSDVNKLDIGKLKNVPVCLNNLKTDGNKLDITNLQTFPVDLNKLSNVLDNHVAKKREFNRSNSKIIGLENKFFSTARLIDKPTDDGNTEDVDKLIEDVPKKHLILLKKLITMKKQTAKTKYLILVV